VTAGYPPSIFERITDKSFKNIPCLRKIRETGKTYIGDMELTWKGETENRVQSVVVAVPKYDLENKFSGAVMTVLSLSAIIDRYIKVESEISGCCWIINSSGTTLVRPDKTNVCTELETLGNTKTLEGTLLKNTLKKGKEGYGEYMFPVVQGGENIIAYAPINAGSGRWFIVIATPYSKTILLARKGFVNIILWTLGLIIMVIMAGISIAYSGAKQLRLKEELKRLREREGGRRNC